MIIHSDWLEEHGDLASAEVLRGLAAAGYASIAGLACMLAAEPKADDFHYPFHPPHGTAVGHGRGEDHAERIGYGDGEPDGAGDLEGGGGDGEGLVGIDAAEVEGIGHRP